MNLTEFVERLEDVLSVIGSFSIGVMIWYFTNRRGGR